MPKLSLAKLERHLYSAGEVGLLAGRRTPAPAEALGELHVALRVESEAQIQMETAGFAKLTSLKSGLMTDLLTGRVRVPEGLELPS